MSESSDSRTLYAQQPHGSIWQIPLDGRSPSPIPELAGSDPSRYWTLLGATIYLLRQERFPYELESFNLKTRKLQRLTTIRTDLMVGTQGITVSPSGDALLFVQRDQRRSSIMLGER